MALSFQQQLEQKVLQKKRDAAAQRSDEGQDAATDGVGAGAKQPSYIGEVICGKKEVEPTVEPTEVHPVSPTDEAANAVEPTKPSHALSPTDVASTLVGLDELQLGDPPSMNKEPCDAVDAQDVAEVAAPEVSDATPVNETAEESIPEDLPAGISGQESFYSARDGYSFEDAVPSAKEEGVGGLERPKKQRKPRKLRPKLQPISRDESSGSTDGLGFGDIVTALSESRSTQGAVLDEPAVTHALEHLSMEETKPFLELLFGSQGLYGDEQDAVTSTVLEYAFGGGSVIEDRNSDEVTENTENTASTHAPEYLDQPATDDAHETWQEDEPEAMNEDAPSTETAKLDLKASIAQLKELCDDDTSVSSESSGETAIIEEYLVDSEAIHTEETLLQGQKTTDYDIALADKPNGVANDVEAELALIEKQAGEPPLQGSNDSPEESEALDIVASILDDVIDRVVERMPPATVEAGVVSVSGTQEHDESQAPPPMSEVATAKEASGSNNVSSLTATEETSEEDVAWTGRIVGLHLPSSSDNTVKPYDCRVDPSEFKKKIRGRKGIEGSTSNAVHQGTSSFLPPNQPTSIALDVYLHKGSPDNPVKVRMICDNPSEDVQTVLGRLQQVVSTKLGEENPGETTLWRERPSGGIQLQISSYDDCLTAWDHLWDATMNVCDLCCGNGQEGAAHESLDEKSAMEGYERVENVHCLSLEGLLNRASKESVGKYAVSVRSAPNDTASTVKLLLDAYPPTITAVSSSLSFDQGRVFTNRKIVVEVGLLCASEARVIWCTDGEPIGVGSSYTPSELDIDKHLAIVVVPRKPNHDGWECAEAYQFKNAVEALPCTEYDEQLHPEKTEKSMVCPRVRAGCVDERGTARCFRMVSGLML